MQGRPASNATRASKPTRVNAATRREDRRARALPAAAPGYCSSCIELGMANRFARLRGAILTRINAACGDCRVRGGGPGGGSASSGLPAFRQSGMSGPACMDNDRQQERRRILPSARYQRTRWNDRAFLLVTGEYGSSIQGQELRSRTDGAGIRGSLPPMQAPSHPAARRWRVRQALSAKAATALVPLRAPYWSRPRIRTR